MTIIVQESKWTQSLRKEHPREVLIRVREDGSRLLYRPGRREPLKIPTYEPRYSPEEHHG
jgi:hypothetical protein